MKRSVLLLLCCLLLAISCALPAAATAVVPYDSSVYDRASLLTDAQRAEVINGATAFYNATGCYFVLYTYSESDPDENFTGEDFLDIYGEPKGLDLVLLILKKEGSSYYYDLYLYGEAERLMTPAEVDIVLDDAGVYPNLKTGKAYPGVSAFLQVSSREMTNTAVRKNPYLRALPVAAVLGVLIAVGTCIAVKVSYGMKKRSVDYPLEHFARLELTERSDTFTGSFVTRRVIQSSSSGGRSGGGSRGGGRGHAGGR